MTAPLRAVPSAPPADAAADRPSPNPNRSRSASRARRRQELLRGNTRAMRHGAFAEVAALPDVATEVDLLFAAHPALDPIRDRRLVELLATSNVRRQRCLLAMERDGMTQTLTAYDARLAPLVERLERAVHERERERLVEASKTSGDPLERFRTARRPPASAWPAGEAAE